MTVTINGTTGITAPAITTEGGLTLDGVTFADNAPANTLVTTSSGNVGIGTSSPNQILEVSKSQNGETQIKAVNANAGSSARAAFVLGNNTSSAASGLLLNGSATTSLGGGNSLNVYQGLTAPITFFTDGSERARIDSSGNLLVGTTNANPSANNVQGCVVNSIGYIAVTGAGTSAIDCNRTNDGLIQAFRRGGTVVGSVSVTSSATSFNPSSDRRLKDNIQPMVDGLDRVMKLKPVTYTWKVNGEFDDGFIAQDLQEIPEFQHRVNPIGEHNGQMYYGVDYMRFVSVLTAAIQEQQAMIAEQSSLITQLRADVEALKGQA